MFSITASARSAFAFVKFNNIESPARAVFEEASVYIAWHFLFLTRFISEA